MFNVEIILFKKIQNESKKLENHTSNEQRSEKVSEAPNRRSANIKPIDDIDDDDDDDFPIFLKNKNF